MREHHTALAPTQPVEREGVFFGGAEMSLVHRESIAPMLSRFFVKRESVEKLRFGEHAFPGNFGVDFVSEFLGSRAVSRGLGRHFLLLHGVNLLLYLIEEVLAPRLLLRIRLLPMLRLELLDMLVKLPNLRVDTFHHASRDRPNRPKSIVERSQAFCCPPGVSLRKDV